MKKVFKGWVGKNDKLGGIVAWDSFGQLETSIEEKRLNKDFWTDEDWPPRKVKVTVEFE
jgi:hypothetical protein